MTSRAQMGFAVLATVLVAACTVPMPFEPAVTGPSPLTTLSATPGGQQRVTGNAHITIFRPGATAERFAFSAVRHADGRVTGQWELFTEEVGGIRLHGVVDCFGIAGNRARLGGTVTQSTHQDIPAGDHVIWTVVDNGEGTNAPPDQTSDLFFAPAFIRDRHCATGINLPQETNTQGNIQVHQ